MPKEKEIQETGKLYELGFHLVSTIPAEKTADEFNKLKDLIISHKGEVVKEGEIKTMNLAYTIIKKIAGQNVRFKQSHFGWVKFTIPSDEVIPLKEDLNLLEDVLRFILIKTVDDYAHSTNRLADEMIQADDEMLEETDESEVVLEETEVLEDEVDKENTDSTEEIDKAIDEIIK
jgi:ribosomal protein S6